MTRAAIAIHKGRCPGCKDPIRPGELIQLVVLEGPRRRWFHEECAPVDAAAAAKVGAR